jgi:hypothetical protein
MLPSVGFIGLKRGFDSFYDEVLDMVNDQVPDQRDKRNLKILRTIDVMAS